MPRISSNFFIVWYHVYIKPPPFFTWADTADDETAEFLESSEAKNALQQFLTPGSFFASPLEWCGAYFSNIWPTKLILVFFFFFFCFIIFQFYSPQTQWQNLTVKLWRVPRSQRKGQKWKARLPMLPFQVIFYLLLPTQPICTSSSEMLSHKTILFFITAVCSWFLLVLDYFTEYIKITVLGILFAKDTFFFFVVFVFINGLGFLFLFQIFIIV